MSFKLTVIGDIYPGDIEKKKYKTMLHEIFPLLEAADFRIANLEYAIADNIGRTGQTVYPILKDSGNFSAESSSLQFLKELGIDAVTLANNHSGDYGEEGIRYTISALEKEEILHVGAGNNIEEAYLPLHICKKDISLSIISVCENEFGAADERSAGTAGFIPEKLIELVENEKNSGKYVVVIFHGGNEYNPLPSPRVVERYRYIADAGASAIIGMHTHCPQGYEYYKDSLIVYSLGDFLISLHDKMHIYPTWNQGFIAQIEITKSNRSVLRIIPYQYNMEEEKFLLLSNADKGLFFNHIDKLNRIISDGEQLEKYYGAWCLHSAPKYTAQFLGSAKLNVQRCLSILNLFRCEAHRELMQTYFEILSHGNQEKYEESWLDLKQLFTILSGNREKIIMKEIESDYDLIALAHREKHILLYGAGMFGKELIRTLPADGKYQIDGILVTDTRENEAVVQGIPVYGIDDADFDKNIMVIIATRNDLQKEIVRTLTEKGYERFSFLNANYLGELNKRCNSMIPGGVKSKV